MREQTVGIVGGGILGLALGREVVRRRPGTRVVVWEKEPELARHQTGHNSGVVHAGLYYEPGSLKAELCTRGRALLRDYCAEHGLPYDECGKLVVATGPEEMGRFEALEQRARANQVPELTRIDGAAIGEIEPHTRGVAALHSPRTAITDFAAVARSLAAEIETAGGEVRLATEVTGVRRVPGGVQVDHDGGRERVDRLVVCAGLQSDRVAGLAQPGVSGPRIVPFRGEYLTVVPERQDLVRGLVYPVPDPRYPFLGVHFTRRVDGGLEVGPNAVLATRREGYRRRDVSARDLADLAAWPGFWRLAHSHWRTGMKEMRGSLSTRAYLAEAQRYVPDLGVGDVRRGRAGVRAQAVDRSGALVDDFRITTTEAITCVRNAPSPAATSCLAIAERLWAEGRLNGADV